MNFQIYKQLNDEFFPIDIKNIRKGDIITVKDLETNESLLNSEGTDTSIVICDASKDDKDNWTIQSKPYVLNNN